MGEVTPAYQHINKLVTIGDDLSLPTAYLKWYDIRPYEVDMPPELALQSRAFLRAEAEAGRLDIDRQLGFVELHHCSSVAFLLVFTWRNENELWETAYAKDMTAPAPFHPFEARNGNHRAVNCVWELAPIWHERQAWVRFLLSPRDETAKSAYLSDRFTGTC